MLIESLEITSRFKNQLVGTFKNYETDEHLPQILRLTKAVTEISKLEVHILEKLQEYTQLESQFNQSQLESDMLMVRRRLYNFVTAYTDQLAKDQFANSKLLSEYDL